MMPMYTNSSQPGQMRPQGCYYQGFGNHPHHVDASSPVSCEHWPTPSPFYGSCVHGNFPAYTPYWPPCYPPQAPYHTCCTNHSGFHPHAPPCYIHQPFPVGYQPGYYESEKDVTGPHRCTKCSPQMCCPKNDRSVVIEEHEPEIDKGDRGLVNHARSTNCPYPIIWIPHEEARNQEHVSHDQPPAEIKAPESTKVHKGDPKSWNGCFPFDENTIKSLMQNQDMKRMPNGKTVELPFDMSKLKSLLRGQEGKDVKIQKNREPGQLQCPVFWIPSHGKQEDVEASERRENSNNRSNLNSFPSDRLNKGQVAQGNKGKIEGNVLSDAEEKSLMRNIPVKSQLHEPRDIPVKLLENRLPEPTKMIGETEPVEDTKKEQRKSPPKASRLPPVCLRVDPLPKRKSGGSKSLSPPRRKEQSLTSAETTVSPVSLKEAETRTIPEACNVKCEEVNKEKKTSEGRPNPTGSEKQSVETRSNLQEEVSCEVVRPCEAKENKEKPAKKTFTEEEAARIIQSRYRGYDVRRWEPITKLKEIATVREKMGDVKKRIQALELSTDQHTEGKEIVVLGEMVMSLLLKLDSVQGLHPRIRDYRKSLARELSGMQENIDSLKKSSEEKEAVEEQAEITTQTGDGPVNLELSQLAEKNEMVSDSNTEKFCPPLEEHLTSLKNTTDGQLVAKAEEVTGLSETLPTDPEAAAETSISHEDSTTIPEKNEAVETVLPINLSSADGNEMTVTNITEDEVMVEKLEEPLPELPQVVETTRGPGFEGPENVTEVSETVANASEDEGRKGDDDCVLPSEKIEAVETVRPVTSPSADGNETTVTNFEEDKVMVEKLEGTHAVPQVVETTLPGFESPENNATEVSETVANASENEDRKGDGDSVLPSKKDAVFPELPVGVVDDEMLLLSQGSLSCAPEADKTVIDPETVSKEEINVDHSNGIGQETRGPGFEGPENATEVSETVANTSEDEDKKGDDDCVLPSENMEAVETVRPVTSSSAGGNETTVTNIVEDKVMVEKLEVPHEVPQVVETRGPGFEGPKDATEVSETVANKSENEDRKGDDDSVLPSEKDVVFPELPVGVIDDELQLLSQGSLSCAPEAEKTVIGPETVNEEINVDHSGETEVAEHGVSEETKKLMEENQRFKETMETLVKAGKEQLEVISKLTGRVKSLEKKLSQKKRTHIGRRKPDRGKQATKPMPAS